MRDNGHAGLRAECFASAPCYSGDKGAALRTCVGGRFAFFSPAATAFSSDSGGEASPARAHGATFRSLADSLLGTPADRPRGGLAMRDAVHRAPARVLSAHAPQDLVDSCTQEFMTTAMTHLRRCGRAICRARRTRPPRVFGQLECENRAVVASRSTIQVMTC